MDFIQVILLALIQGLTEWLPISSSGHLVIAQALMGLTVPVAFDVLLHLGTLVSVLIYFWKDITAIARSVFSFDTKSMNFRLFLLVIVGSIPTAIIGYVFLNFFESLFENPVPVGFAFLLTGVLLLSTKLGRGKRDLDFLRAAIIGTVQGLAIAPGISRSGSTISAGLLCGVEKAKAFRFSFLLSIPAVLGATLLKYNEIVMADVSASMLAGVAAAAVVGYLAIKIVSKMVLSNKFYLFSIYCFLAGIAVLAYFL
jgi:undecaprenyl-diphosphatase